MSEMKPQCNTSADCLRELARVMDQFGISDPFDAVLSEYVKCNDKRWSVEKFPTLNRPELWQFAIAEVEGKPVFPYQEGLYCRDIPVKPVQIVNGRLVLLDGSKVDASALSWNPPRPKTVTVTYTIDEAKRVINALENYAVPVAARSALAATEKSLKELK